MKDACFCVPVHPPKFSYALEFIRTYNTFYNDDHIFLVFSNQEESDFFYNLLLEHHCPTTYRSIICTQPIMSSPTTQKKFFGLKYIFENTDFINVAAIDIDCKFFKHVDYSILFENFNKKGVVYGNDYEFAPWPTVQSPFKFFNQFDQQRLFELTGNGRIYYWFNDVSVFNKQWFLEFYDYVNLTERWPELQWTDFDFIFYSYYLLLKGYLKIEPILINGNLISCSPFIEFQSVLPKEDFDTAFELVKSMWIHHDTDPSLMENTFMYVHVDRE